jgi:glycosidase
MQQPNKNLNLVKEKLVNLQDKFKDCVYFVPALWLNFASDLSKMGNNAVKVNPIDFFLNQINTIETFAIKNSPMQKDFEIEDAVIYNSFIRLNTAFDYTKFLSNKERANPQNSLFKKTGTFLKTISILPYLKSLGVNVLYLLPITKIGIDRKKGNLGSCYAIKNHYQLDENLSEPFLGLSAETEFAALVESCHLMGIKVILEFVFRTASIDNDLIPEHPDWFYWVDEQELLQTSNKLLPPTFEAETLQKIKAKVEVDKDFSDLPAPNQDYISLFKDVPEKVILNKGKFIGQYSDKTTAIIPNAFADWPPDDKQPIWDDVTYLKLYNNPEFNYIAYNTVRMYDNELIKNGKVQQHLWDYLEGIIPFYIDKFNINGVMVDMGHALPQKLLGNIINKAKEKSKDFLFFEENFSVEQKSKEKGFNAVVGYLPFDIYNYSKMKAIVQHFENEDFAISFFGASENHNTPRTTKRFQNNADNSNNGSTGYNKNYNSNFSKFCFAMIALMPVIPFVHNGFELFEQIPVNTGLDFTSTEQNQFTPYDLALFSESYLNWLNAENLNDVIRYFVEIRKSLLGKKSIELLDLGENVLSFSSRNKYAKYLFVGNYAEKQIIDLSNYSFVNNLMFLNEGSYIQSEKKIILQKLGFAVFAVY